MAARSTRSRKLTMKGIELLERNLRSRCASAFREASTVVKKLSPLLKTTGTGDVDLVRQYFDDFRVKVSCVARSRSEYFEKFAGDLELLGDFDVWFRPRHEALVSLLDYTEQWLSSRDTGISMPVQVDDPSYHDTALDYNDPSEINPEDSASQVSSRHSDSSKTRSKSTSKQSSRSKHSSSRGSSIKSARIKESLKRVSLQAEANSLSQKQELMRKEFEINLEKQTLDLSTKLAIASAKEEVLLDLHPSGSEISGSSYRSSRLSVSVKSKLPVSRPVRPTDVASVSDELSVRSVRESKFRPTDIASFSEVYPSNDVFVKSVAPSRSRPTDVACLSEVHDFADFSVQSVPPSKSRLADVECLPEGYDSSGLPAESVNPCRTAGKASSRHGVDRAASSGKLFGAPHAVRFDDFTSTTRVFDDRFEATDLQHRVDDVPVQQQQVMQPQVFSESHNTRVSVSCFDDGLSGDAQANSSTSMVNPAHSVGAVKTVSSVLNPIHHTDHTYTKQSTVKDAHVPGPQNTTSTPFHTLSNIHTLNPSSPEFIPRTTNARSIFTPQVLEDDEYHNTLPPGDDQWEIKPHMSGVVGETQFEVVLSKLTDVLTDQRSRLPEVVVAKFQGDPMEYNSFVRCFDSRIASRTTDDAERLYYLEQYTSGTPRELIRSCLHLPPHLGYSAARKKLHDRYGDPFLLSQSYLSKLESWPAIRIDDPKHLDEFTTFLTGCLNAMVSYNSIRELDYPTSLRMVVSKLPSYLQDRWARTVDDILHGGKGTVTFSKLVSFIEKENRVKMNPVFGKSALSLSAHNKSVTSQPKKKITSAATLVKQESKPESKPDHKSDNKPASNTQISCLFCSNKHPFAVCNKFRKILHKDKIMFLMRHRLCFDCLCGDHVRSQCSKDVKCGVCGENHNTLLHRVKQEDPQKGKSVHKDVQTELVSAPVSVDSEIVATDSPVESNSAGISRSRKPNTMPIIPVRLKSIANNTEICTHAFLDSGSSDSFISDRLMKDLGVKGKKTTINLTTLNSDRLATNCFAISNLQVCGLNKDTYISLPVVYTQSSLPVSADQIPSQEDLDFWPYLSQVEMPYLDSDVGILIGNNVPKASEPWHVINSEGNGPYAVLTSLGWVVNGPLRDMSMRDGQNPDVSSHRIQLSSSLENQVQRFFDLDFSERHVFSEDRALSVEDKQFLDMVERRTSLVDGHYEVCLPLRDQSVRMPNNRSLAFQRLMGLKRKFRGSDTFQRKYTDFIDDLFVKGHASRVPDEEVGRDDGLLWYLPHHGVIHARKDKLRVVLDASATFAGISLNNQLLSGPDLSSSLIGVLNRFRQNRVGFMADIECMFYQVKVPSDQRDLLRFLWWSEGDVEKEIIECRMHAHIFGATSSPAVAKYALRRTAFDHASEFSTAAVDTVNRSFYVDDCLKSVPTVEEAVSLASELRLLTQKGGFRLTQWISNDRGLLNSIPESERAKNVKEVDLDYDELPTQKALGVLWSVEEDTFGFHVNIPDKPASRRGILSIVSSVYDPLGMAAPVVLSGKMIVQELCRRKMGWDDQISDDLAGKWQEWLDSLPYLDRFSISRCLFPVDFGHLAKADLHHFADASEYGYGSVSFLRMEDHVGHVHCSFMFGKSRVAPLKQMTIPRMELAGAVLAVRVDRQLRSELDISVNDSYFWSDSMSVLGYVKNEKARFRLFVANRVAAIHESSSPSQWRYVPTQLNPADDASRGLDGEGLVRCERWRNGPSFLWQSEDQWPVQPNTHQVNDSDPELKTIVCAASQSVQHGIIQRILSYFSDWHRLRRFVALLCRARRGVLHRASRKPSQVDPRRKGLSVTDFQDAERVIIRWTQEEYYGQEITMLGSEGCCLPKSSKLAPLSPVLVDGVLRVGGRIGRAPISDDLKHPVILPAESPVARLLVQNVHECCGHGGREQVLSRLRQKYWITHGNALCRRELKRCVFCRRKFGSPLQQRMADLPSDRVSPGQPPFTDTGVDYFGPVMVKRGRSQVKRYGALFTCLATRAVHIEMAASLETDAFINALRRFIARRGQVRHIRSDNGTNFVGAERELKEAVREWKEDKIQDFLNRKNISWQFNAPGASHHGGVWERLIRSTRRVLVGLAREQVLTDDGLSTLFAEAESILNGRPLTRSSSDASDLTCLTPNHLLLLGDQQTLPPGIFSKEDNFVRRRWRQIQFLADVFWKRWVREYLVLLQRRQKWLLPKRSVKVNDIVLVVDQNAPRGSWLLGKVEKTFPDRNGHVRNVTLKTRSSTLTRPISKLVMVLECDESL